MADGMKPNLSRYDNLRKQCIFMMYRECRDDHELYEQSHLQNQKFDRYRHDHCVYAKLQEQKSGFNRAVLAPDGDGDNTSESKVRSEYTYELLPSGGSIRLLKLEPGNNDEMLRSTIGSSYLEAQPKYTVLSYAWDGRDEVAPLVINDNIMFIQDDLARALRAIRDPERQLSLWVDAICINIDDISEKASQIKQMAEVYHQAESIVIWPQVYNHEARWICDWNCHHDFLTSFSDICAHLRNKHSYNPYEIDDIFDMANGSHSTDIFRLNSQSERKENTKNLAENRLRLRKLFSTCDDDEFPFLAITLSTTLTSFRALRPAEIARVAALSMSTEMSLRDMDDMTKFLAIRGLYQDTKTQYLLGMLRSKWSEVLHIDQQGYVRFTSESMGGFFSKFPIRGVDINHGIIANACLRELEFGVLLAEIDRSLDGNGRNSPCALSNLSPYATQFWHLHYGLAEKLGQAPLERMHKLLWRQFRAVSHPHLVGQLSPTPPCSFRCGSCVELAFAYCEKHGFRVLGNAYAQMKAVSHVNVAGHRIKRNQPGLGDQGQRLGAEFIQLHIRSDTERHHDYDQDSSDEKSSPVTSYNLDWHSDNTDSNTNEEDWLMVDHLNCESELKLVA